MESLEGSLGTRHLGAHNHGEHRAHVPPPVSWPTADTAIHPHVAGEPCPPLPQTVPANLQDVTGAARPWGRVKQPCPHSVRTPQMRRCGQGHAGVTGEGRCGALVFLLWVQGCLACG